MKTDELREKYLAFFESKGHTRCTSDVLVPRWDPSVLFTPAGMNPFKDHFLGRVKLEFTRATSCQKCLRTGDIDNVGRTAYHHTFFEMLGNFSFGDYFKEEAIHWAWEFLTEKKWLGIDPDRLTVTVYLDDDEAANIWHKKIGLATNRIERLGEDENFWPASAPSQGPDGVCGPCSEIYYHPPGAKKSVEIWNLVFTQFNRVGNPPDNLRPLPSKNIDTGAGLERVASVLQGVDTNYHIDILRPLVEAAGDICSVKYDPADDNGRRLRRIADHVRACTMAIHENVLPGPNREKYVIRRLLRRAVLDGHQMGRREPFLYQLVPVVAELMKRPYPELSETIDRVVKGIKAEEGVFLGTLDAGLARVSSVFNQMKAAGKTVVPGSDSFELYTTFGMPPEMVEQMAAELNYSFDWTTFKEAMEGHAVISGKLAMDTGMDENNPIGALKKALHETEFLAYQAVEAQAEIKGIVAQDHLVDAVTEVGHEQPIIVVLDRSPFYGESGGQVGDTGEIVGSDFRFEVTDTQKDGDLLLHYGHLRSGTMKSASKVTAKVDTARRDGIRRAHSATHILQYALQKNLGGEVHQMGSKVDNDWLRFDFGYPGAVDFDKQVAVQADVLDKVSAGKPVEWKFVPLAEARSAGAMMLFGEKYPDPARMVSMGDFSRELCAGTHLDNTGEVGTFDIIAEEAVAAGVRRITALTGERAKAYLRQTTEALEEIATRLSVPPLEAAAAVKQLAIRLRELKKQLSAGAKTAATSPAVANTKTSAVLTATEAKQGLREINRMLNVALFDAPSRVAAMIAEAAELEVQLSNRATGDTLSVESLAAQGERIGGALVVVCEVPNANSNMMREWIDNIRQQHGTSAVFLATTEGADKVVLVASVSKDLIAKGLSAGNWVKEIAPIVGGGGGGKPDLAQAGGKNAAKVADALIQARAVIKTWLS